MLPVVLITHLEALGDRGALLDGQLQLLEGLLPRRGLAAALAPRHVAQLAPVQRLDHAVVAHRSE